MKKWLIIFGLLFIAIIAAVYFLIPTNQQFNYQITVNCTESAVARRIINKEKWQWWQGQKEDSSIYSYKNYNYKIDKILFNGLHATVSNNKDSIKGTLLFSYYGNDYTQFFWSSTYNLSTNPFKKIVQYVKLKKIEKNTEDLLQDVKKYFDKEENIYGMKIIKERVTESSMISIKDTFPNYPSTEEIYDMINSLKEYIKKTGGEETNHPMLHVQQHDSTTYEAMVAVPTKSDLPSEGKFRLKKMMVGNILMAEVKGGLYTVIKGEQELTNYVNDYKKIAPAIPFQSLVTNRLLETDTSKWITRLYYPVFQ